MIKRELAKDPKLADQDWSRFLPKFGKRKAAKKTTAATGANNIEVNGAPGSSAASTSSYTPFPAAGPSATKKEKKPYTPFPPAQTPRKIDLELASGEYFLKPHEKRRKKLEERQEKSDAVREEKTKKRMEQFVAPDESQPRGDAAMTSADAGEKKAKKRKREAEQDDVAAADGNAPAKVKKEKKAKKGVSFADAD